MSTFDHLFDSALSLARRLRAGELSAAETVDACLAQIERVNPTLNAVVTLAEERAREEARVLDGRRASGAECGPLHGVPITFKDSFDTEGIRSTASTAGRRNHVPTSDATVVHRLRQAGAIILGKTNTPELTMGPDTVSPLFGRTNNPYQPDYSPSGSSGGAAANIAAGGAALEFGSDTGGSIREPAHVCGIVGLKPTQGRIPKTGHAIAHGVGLLDSITQVGPMARYVEDVEAALHICGGPDRADFTCVPASMRPSADVDVRAMRVLHFGHNGLWPVTAEIERVVNDSARVVSDTGATTIELAPPPIASLGSLYSDYRVADGGWGLRRLLESFGTEQPGEDLQRRIDGCQLVTPDRLAELSFQIDQFKGALFEFMQDYDALICPPCPYAPWPHEAALNLTYQEWSYCTAFNLTGWPALVLRAGTSEQGMPIGVQLVAKPWREDIVLALGKHIESALGGYQSDGLCCR